MSAFVDSLRSEIARLGNQLMHAKALLQSYEGAAGAGTVQQRRSAGNGSGRYRPFQPKGTDSKEHKVRIAIREFLAQQGGSAHRTAILEHVKSLGLMGHESESSEIPRRVSPCLSEEK
jgi:hypothetical protein